MPYGIKQTKNKRYNPYQSSTPGSGGSREPTKYVPRGDTHRFASAASTAMAVAPVAPASTNPTTRAPTAITNSNAAEGKGGIVESENRPGRRKRRAADTSFASADLLG